MTRKPTWKPSSLRVKRRSDGREFSCSLGAARHYGLPIARKIEWSCDGLIGVVENSQWEWIYDQPAKDFGNIEVLRNKLKEYYGVEESSIPPRNYYRKIGKATSPAFRGKAFILVEFFRSYSELEESKSVQPIQNIYLLFLSWACNNKKEIVISSDRAMGKHLRAWEMLYRKTSGIILSYINIGPGVWRSGARLDESLIDSNFSVYDEIPEYREERPRSEISDIIIRIKSKGFPVYCENTGITYPSLTAASKALLIQPYDIKFCCENDIDNVFYGEEVWTFKYGRWEDVSVEWFIESPVHMNSTKGIQIIDLNSGEVYASIRMASKITRLRPKRIQEFCKMGNKEGPGLLVNRIGYSPEYFKFDYYTEETYE